MKRKGNRPIDDDVPDPFLEGPDCFTAGIEAWGKKLASRVPAIDPANAAPNSAAERREWETFIATLTAFRRAVRIHFGTAMTTALDALRQPAGTTGHARPREGRDMTTALRELRRSAGLPTSAELQGRVMDMARRMARSLENRDASILYVEHAIRDMDKYFVAMTSLQQMTEHRLIRLAKQGTTTRAGGHKGAALANPPEVTAARKACYRVALEGFYGNSANAGRPWEDAMDFLAQEDRERDRERLPDSLRWKPGTPEGIRKFLDRNKVNPKSFFCPRPPSNWPPTA